MFITNIEQLMADASELFMAPVILSILVLFIYALFTLGRFISQMALRKNGAQAYAQQAKTFKLIPVAGYDLHNYFIKDQSASEDELEVYALKKLESLRIVTRVSPMLGLIATMIPMGPALQGLADGNIQSISENLIIAFAAVIWGLVVSTITFWPASVKKRWYADELITLRKIKQRQETQTVSAETNVELKGAK